jgi:hypothetical protein
MLGNEPIVETMVIVSGQDFSHFFGVAETSSSFPPGTALTLKIFGRDDGAQLGAWPAVAVQSGGALVQISSEDLLTVPDGSVFRVYVTYPGDQDLCWYRGRVWRRT